MERNLQNPLRIQGVKEKEQEIRLKSNLVAPATSSKTLPIKENGNYYVRNKDLLPEIIKCRDEGRISEYLGEMLLLIVNNYARRSNWSNYTYRDDMKGHAMVHLTNAALKFDPKRSQNPFAYYTQVTKNAFIQILKQERKHRDIRDAKLLDQGLDPSFSFQEHWKAEIEAQRKAKVESDEEEIPRGAEENIGFMEKK